MSVFGHADTTKRRESSGSLGNSRSEVEIIQTNSASTGSAGGTTLPVSKTTSVISSTKSVITARPAFAIPTLSSTAALHSNHVYSSPSSSWMEKQRFYQSQKKEIYLSKLKQLQRDRLRREQQHQFYQKRNNEALTMTTSSNASSNSNSNSCTSAGVVNPSKWYIRPLPTTAAPSISITTSSVLVTPPASNSSQIEQVSGNSIGDGEELSYQCKDCNRVFQHVQTLQAHRQMHFGRTTCEICEKVFSNIGNRNAHIKMHHPDAGPGSY